MNVNEEIKKHKFILFGQDHYNPLGILRSLGEEGIPCYVILIAKHPSLVNHSKYAKHISIFDTNEEGLEFLLKTFGNEKYKPFVYTGCDEISSLLDLHYDELKDKFYFYNCGEQGRTTKLMHKDIITGLGRECGFAIPNEEVVKLGELPKTLKYPIITKTNMSIMGGWKNDVFICKSEEELKEAFKKIKSPVLCLQEYIYKKGEFCVEGFSVNHGQDICIPYKFTYIRLYNKSYGQYMRVDPLDDEQFIAKIKAIFAKTRFEGNFEIEFMVGPDDTIYFLEINFRNSTWGYAPSKGGVNMALNWAKSMLLGRVDTECYTRDTTPYTAMVEPDDFYNNVLRGSVPLRRWIKECKGCKCHYYYSKDDPWPFYTYMWHRSWRKIFKTLHLRK